MLVEEEEHLLPSETSLLNRSVFGPTGILPLGLRTIGQFAALAVLAAFLSGCFYHDGYPAAYGGYGYYGGGYYGGDGYRRHGGHGYRGYYGDGYPGKGYYGGHGHHHGHRGWH